MTDDVTYTFEPVAVEGSDPIAPTEEQVEQFTTVAKEWGLNQEQAQRFAARELTREPTVVEKDPVAPDNYEFANVKGEDGTEAPPPEDVTNEVVEFAKANGLTQAQAQAVLDRELTLASKAGEESEAAVKSLQQGWRDELMKDPDFGGAKLEENVAIGKKALSKFFPGLVGSENKHPFLDHPEVVKGLNKIGKLIGEDNEFVPAGGGSGEETSLAKRFYPSMN